MTVSTREPAGSLSQRLIELLEEARDPRADGPALRFAERLDDLELEALERCPADAVLVMIRVAREAIGFAERITARTRCTGQASVQAGCDPR